jgi:hypothetical protein
MTASDIEKARTHQHWLVRLACLALCDIDSQSVLSDTATNGDGGALWIDRLVKASSDSPIRAVNLNPDQLSMLQTVLGRQEGKHLIGMRLLEALAPHHLHGAFVVDEQRSVEIRETDFEIASEG